MKAPKLLACLVSMLFVSVIAAGPSPAVPQERERPPGDSGLPIGFTPEELALRHTIGQYRPLTSPPMGPVRGAAEWEESIGVFTLWSNAELIHELQKENDVYIITTNQSWWLNWLSSNGIPATNFHFILAPTNSIYTRDYGPWFIWDGTGEFGLVDNIYNRPRPDDDVIPGVIAREYGIPYYFTNLVHTGGNYYMDGYNNAWSTRLVYKENPGMTKEQVDQIMQDYLGITRYVTWDIAITIEHFDTFGKLLAPDTLLWGQFPEKTMEWNYTEAALKYFKTLQSPYGWPYKVHRMPLWDFGSTWTAYINALQTNRKIITGKYYTAHDAEAKAIYEAAAPGYDVINVNAGGTSWGDSIHCRTRNYHKGDTIRIYPKPHWEFTDEEVNPYEVTAEVIPHPSTTLKGNPEIRWTVTGGPPFSHVVMGPTGNPDEYGGFIPAQPHGTTVSYHFHAEDTAGNVKDCPLVTPRGLFTIQVEDDTIPPDLDHDTIHGLALGDWPPTVTCTSVDNGGIPEVAIEYKINGVPQAPVTMVKEEGTFVFTGVMTGAVALNDLIAYRVVAADGASPQNTASSPPVGWNHFMIGPKNSVLVIELDKSPDSGSVLVDICDDLGLPVQYATTWPSDLTSYDYLMICLGMSPCNTSLTTSQANTLVSFLNQGGCAYMEGGNCWAQDGTKNIYRPYFGIGGASSGTGIGGDINGVPGAFTEGMAFGYYGEIHSSDHLTPDAAAMGVLECLGDIKAVTYDTGTFRSAASSFQVGSLVCRSGTSHIKYLTACYLEHLGMDFDLVVHGELNDPRWVRFDLEGDGGGGYMLFYALGPGYIPKGPAGVIRIDPGTLSLLLAGVMPSEGKLDFQVLVPNDPAFDGLELYFQAYVEDTGSGQSYLTNRDRIRL